MEFELGFRRIDRRWLFAVVLVAVTHLLLQSFLLPYGNALRSLLPDHEPTKSIRYDARSSSTIRNTLTVNASDPIQEENNVFSSESVDIIRKFDDDQIPGPNASLSSRRSDSGSLETRLQRSKTSTPSKNISLASQTTKSSTAIVPGPKKMRCDTPPKTVTTFQEMNQILIRHRAKSRAPVCSPSDFSFDSNSLTYSFSWQRPLWSSPRDQEILAARAAIERAPVARDDKELYAPIFRNISTFKK